MGIWTPGPGATGGNDTYEGDGTDETVDGLGGNDTLRGRGGADTLTGGEGDDTLMPGNDFVADILSGGNGYDILDYSEITEDGVNIYTWDSVVFRSAVADQISGFEEYVGTATGDVITVQSGGVLRGGAGNDILFGNNADIYGGSGRDFFAVFSSPNTIHDFEVGVDFFTNSSVTSVALDGSDTLVSFFNGTVFRVVGVTGLSLAQWQAHQTSGWFINSADTDDVSTGFNLAEYFWGGAGNDTLDAAGGNDSVYGGPGADTLTGGDGADMVDGGSGDDILVINSISSLAGDTFAGGSGTDTIRIFSNVSGLQEFLLSDATLSSIERIEFASALVGPQYVYVNASQFGAGLSTSLQLAGSALDDLFTIFMSTAGSVSVNSFSFVNWGVNDLIIIGGSNGDDTIIGSAQRDWILAGGGADTISGDGGNDDLRGEGGADSIFGGEGADLINGGADADTLLGNNGDDTLTGGGGADFLGGGGGNDAADYFFSPGAVTVDLQAGLGVGSDAQGDTYGSIEIVYGSAQNDTLSGRDFVTDALWGEDGDDVLMGRYGADILNGGPGVDTISYANSLTAVDVRLFSGFAAGGEATGDSFNSVENIIGSALTDTLAGDNTVNVIWGGAGNETITGREGADTLRGEDGNDTLLGGADADTLIGGLGNDTLGGGAANDTADYSASNAAVTVNLQTGAGSGGHAQGDAYASIENVIGSSFADTFVGKANSWDNIFDGRGGNDTMTGGLGADTFVFRLNEGSDTVTDFSAGAASGDVIQMAGWGAAFDSFAEMIAVATQSGGDVVFNFGNGQTLTLQSVTLGNLNAGDFIFGP
jgi:Ca2+-binding RTX toxin-like protein